MYLGALGVDSAALTLERSRRPLRDECKQQATLYSLDKAESLHHARSKKPTRWMQLHHAFRSITQMSMA